MSIVYLFVSVLLLYVGKLLTRANVHVPALVYFTNGDQGPARITAEVVKQANELVVSVDANKGDMFEVSDLGKHQVHTFPNNKSTLLKLLAPTESAL